MKICQKGLTLKRKISQADERRKEINDVAENVENLLLLETGKNDLIPKGTKYVKGQIRGEERNVVVLAVALF